MRKAALAIALAALWSATAYAQLDPLRFLRRVPPTIIIVLDTSMRMLEDGNGFYHDPNTYRVSDDIAAATGLNVLSATTYRRKYRALEYESPSILDPLLKYKAEDIIAVPNTSADYASFYAATRLELAKAGIDAAVSESSSAQARWGLIKLRQTSPAWRTAPLCDKPVRVTGNLVLAALGDLLPCLVAGLGRFGIYVPSVASPNYANEIANGGGARVVTPGSGTAAFVLTAVRRPINDAAGLIPAGIGGPGYEDRPITHALEDARAAAAAAMVTDGTSTRECRNTIVVLITAGEDSGSAAYTATHNPESLATTFRTVTAGGVTRRVPIHVVSINPATADETELQNIAANSGGRYRRAATADDVAAAINYAVQQGYSRADDIDTGTTSEFLPVSPVVGTVDLKGARDSNGATLPNTDIVAAPGGQPLPQRSNLLLSSGFTLPGFDGVLRAFRAYKPVSDSTRPTGWKFTKDGTPLWPDLDGRPSMKGKARTPSDPNARNLYTYIPDGSGGGSVVAFTAANEPALRPHMNAGPSAASLISFIRAQPLGAVVNSMPAIMDPPSLDPPPDLTYGYPDSTSSFAGRFKNRRSLIFFGANDGMIHAVDARTGYEVWAFIPYNLLPKLRALRDGQSVEQFDYFVDSSPKIAELKIAGEWRNLLLIGQGWGGTFYQAFDVTDAGMGVDPSADGLNAVTAMLQQFDSPDESIQFKWAFPNYSSFDPSYTAVLPVLDGGTPGGRLKIFGDVKATATLAEKTVGFTWSAPAIGPVTPDRSVSAIVVGSGYFPDVESSIPSRGAGGPKAGNALYMLNPATGTLFGNATACTAVSSGSGSGTGCVSVASLSSASKNALQADPSMAGQGNSHVMQKAYLGDVDGRFWRFDFTAAGSISATQMISTSRPIYGSSALATDESGEVHMFFSTGSDMLPATAAGGTGTFKLYGLRDDAPAAGATVRFTQDLATVTNTASSGIASGERPSASPSIAGDIVFFTTTTETASAPCSDYTAKLYGFTFAGGAAYDANGSGKIENNETPVAATVAGRATAPFVVDQHLYFGSSGATGANVEVFGDPDKFNNGVGQAGVRILTWREIR